MKTFLLLFATVSLCASAGVEPIDSASEKAELSSLNNVNLHYQAKSNSSPFERVNTFDDRTVVKDPIGYFIYDMTSFRADFTESSFLYLCELKVDFTPGSVASKNESGYDWHYDFWAAVVSLSIPSTLKNVKVMDYWPTSSTITTSLSSSYGKNYNLSLNGGVNLGGGAYLGGSIEQGFSITHTTTSSSSDPKVSSQLLSGNTKKAVWNVDCITQRGMTYNFSCFLLIEMAKSDTRVFSFSSSIDMTCIAWKGYLWEQKKHVVAKDSISAF